MKVSFRRPQPPTTPIHPLIRTSRNDPFGNRDMDSTYVGVGTSVGLRGPQKTPDVYPHIRLGVSPFGRDVSLSSKCIGLSPQ